MRAAHLHFFCKNLSTAQNSGQLHQRILPKSTVSGNGFLHSLVRFDMAWRERSKYGPVRGREWRITAVHHHTTHRQESAALDSAALDHPTMDRLDTTNVTNSSTLDQEFFMLGAARGEEPFRCGSV
jgi:hypothetical protein